MAEDNRGLPDFPAAPATRSTARKLGPVAGGVAALAAIAGISYQDASGTVEDVQQHESGGKLHLTAYLDSVRIPTICDGIIRWPDGRPVQLGDTATPDQCQAMLINEVLPRARALVRCAPQLYGRTNQIRALIDLSYNAGVAGICDGTIGRDIRAGDWAGAEVAIAPWDRGTFPRPQPGPNRDCRRTARGWLCRIPGLTYRRAANQARFHILRPAQGVR